MEGCLWSACLEVEHVEAGHAVLAHIAPLATHGLVAAAAERERALAWARHPAYVSS